MTFNNYFAGVLFFFYSLIATMSFTNDAIKYSKRKITFINLKKL